MVAAMLNGHTPQTNGVTPSHSRKLRPGIFAPIPTFFLPETEDLDIETFEKHVVRIATAGVGPLLAGSMGEAHHLLHDERITLIKVARRALDAAGLSHVPIIAGTGAGSLRETIILTKAAAAAGADYSIVIASGYFAGALANDKDALISFWTSVAEHSPIPVLIYNYPGAAGGIDLDSDTIIAIARASSNIIGVKLTCGNVGKLTRICSVVSHPSFSETHPRSHPDVAPQFVVLGGFTDFVIPSTFAAGHGAITGLANVAPYACVRLFELGEQLKANLTNPSAKSDPGLLAEAVRLQGVIAQADRTMALGGISGTKAVMEKMWGYGGSPRRPLPPISKSAADALWKQDTVQDLLRDEKLAMNLVESR